MRVCFAFVAALTKYLVEPRSSPDHRFRQNEEALSHGETVVILLYNIFSRQILSEIHFRLGKRTLFLRF